MSGSTSASTPEPSESCNVLMSSQGHPVAMDRSRQLPELRPIVTSTASMLPISGSSNLDIAALMSLSKLNGSTSEASLLPAEQLLQSTGTDHFLQVRNLQELRKRTALQQDSLQLPIVDSHLLDNEIDSTKTDAQVYEADLDVEMIEPSEENEVATDLSSKKDTTIFGIDSTPVVSQAFAPTISIDDITEIPVENKLIPENVTSALDMKNADLTSEETSSIKADAKEIAENFSDEAEASSTKFSTRSRSRSGISAARLARASYRNQPYVVPTIQTRARSREQPARRGNRRSTRYAAGYSESFGMYAILSSRVANVIVVICYVKLCLYV